MRQLVIIALGLLQLGIAVQGKGYYSVVGPGTIHAERKYNVAVGVHNTLEPSQLKIGITGPSYNESKVVDLQPNEIQNIEFDVPYLENGDYNLTAEGLQGIVFKNTTKLTDERVRPIIKIQTDKGAYKPGDTINFRALFVNENLRPGKVPKNTVIVLEDAKSNRIKEIKNFDVVKGVYTGNFVVSEFANLGSWRIKIESPEIAYPTTAYIQVEKYVLPKYTVKVEATENVAVKDGELQVVVRANYTYGKPVDGKATVILDLSHGYQEPELPLIIKSTDMVQGKAKFTIDVKSYATYFKEKDWTKFLDITGTVEEAFTGVKINGSAYSYLHGYRWKFLCERYDTCNRYDADKQFEMPVQVLHVNGAQTKDTKSTLKAIFTEKVEKMYSWRYRSQDDEDKTALPKIDNKVLTFESQLNETSFAHFTIQLPDLQDFENFTHFFDVEIQYADEQRSIGRTFPKREVKEIPAEPTEESKDYFDLNVQYPEESYNLKIGKSFVITFNSSQPLPYVVYNLIARGNILESKRIELPEQPQVYNLTVTPSFLYAPYARVYAFYVDANGELHYSETTINVELEYENTINVTAPEEVKPGTEVALRIKTAPESFVGILAVDQSVLLHRDNDNFRYNDFKWRVGNYDTHTPWQGGYSRYPGQYSGVVTLTNADYFYNYTNPYPVGVAYISGNKHGAVDRTGVEVQQSVGFAGSAMGAQRPVADSASSESPSVRKDFSETWIFADIENTETEEFTWTKKIPDTITTWVLSAFSINPTKGLGILEEDTKIRTFQPFFISVRLPYSVKRGEIVNVPALVFNYLSKDLDVDITLDNSDGEFDFTDVSNEIINETQRKRNVRVPAYSAVGVSFLIRPKVVGNTLLKLTATSPIAGDAVHRSLKVVPEGVTKYVNRAFFVNLKDQPEQSENFELILPAQIVPGSKHIEFAVVADLLGPLLNNLEHLIRLPAGCGEQTTSALTFNLLVWHYLENTGKLTDNLRHRIQRNLEQGYQHILSYRLDDGSFGSFPPILFRNARATINEEPRNGSTWLTAYVLRSLNQAQKYIDVDQKVLNEGFKWLISRQAANGSFPETGDWFYSSQRNHVTLTARVLLTLIDNATLSANYQNNINLGFKYLLENWQKTDDLLAKAVSTYALKLAKHELAAEQLSQLKTLAKTEDDRTWWSQEKVVDTKRAGWWIFPYTSEVELTSYILLSLLNTETESTDNVLPIIRWLVSQRNSYGGFTSTQDTLVGLHALILFAEKSGYKPAIGAVEFTANGAKSKQEKLQLTEDNGLLLQSVELPADTESVNFTVKGTGAALVQISYQYNVNEEPLPSFKINNVLNKETPAHKLQLDACVEYVGEGEASNMAIVEISLPSGFTADGDTFDEINAVQHVRQTETKNDNTIIVVYFERLFKNDIKCLPIVAYQTFAVALQKPSPVVVYDYYDTSRKASAYYEVNSKVCDICEGDEECVKACAT